MLGSQHATCCLSVVLTEPYSEAAVEAQESLVHISHLVRERTLKRLGVCKLRSQVPKDRSGKQVVGKQGRRQPRPLFRQLGLTLCLNWDLVHKLELLRVDISVVVDKLFSVDLDDTLQLTSLRP